MTIEQTATVLATSVRTVARMQADGLLEPVYEGTPRNPRARRRFRREQVEDMARRTAASR